MQRTDRKLLDVIAAALTSYSLIEYLVHAQ